MDDSLPQKRCTKCREIKALTDFARKKASSDGYTSQCKVCRNAHERARYIPKVRPQLPEGYKRCSICKELKPATREYFTVNQDRLRSACKPCHKAQSLRHAYLIRTGVPAMKRCPHCQQTKAIDEFHRVKSRYDRHSPYCKNCARERRALLHPKKGVSPSLPPGHKRCNQCMQIKPLSAFSRQKGGYRSHCKACVRLHRQSTRADEREYKRWRYRQNPERERIYARTRKARKNAIAGTHTAAQIQEQLKRQHYRCYYAACGHAKFQRKREKGKWKYKYHVEHTFPIARITGTDIPGNDMSYLVLACPSCNESKHDKFPWEWIDGGRLL